MNNTIITTIGDEIGITLQEQIRLCKKYHLKYLEMRKIENKLLCDFTDEEIQVIHNYLDKEGIKVLTVDTPIGKKQNAFQYAKNLELLHIYLRIARVLNAKYLRIFADIGLVENSMQARQLLTEFANHAEQYNIKLLLENEKGTSAESAAQCYELIQNIDNIYILFDVENAYTKGYDVIDDYLIARTKIAQIHIRDCVCPYGKAVYIGQGTIPIKDLVEKIIYGGYEVALSMETMLPKYHRDTLREELFGHSYECLINIINLYKINL